MMHLIRNGYSTMRQKIWEPESVSTKDEVPESISENGEVDEVFKKYISHRLANATKDGYDYTLYRGTMRSFVLNDPLFRHDMNKMSIEQILYLVEEFIKLCSFHGAEGKSDAASTIMDCMGNYFSPLYTKRKISSDHVRRFIDLCWQNSPCDYISHRKSVIIKLRWPDEGDKEKYAASKELDAFVKCIETEPDKMTWGPGSFPNKGKVDEVFKKYIGYKLAEAVKGNGYPRRTDPLFKRDWGQMSAEQKLYLVEECIKIKTFYGAQDYVPARIMIDMAYMFDDSSKKEFSTDQIRRFIDVCWQNNPCMYLRYRPEAMSFWRLGGDIEKYAASKELDAYTKCIENEPFQARYYVNKFPKGTIQKIFSLNERTELFKKSVSFPYCKYGHNEAIKMVAKGDAEGLAEAWSPDRSIFDPELPLWKRCGLTQADLNEIQMKL